MSSKVGRFSVGLVAAFLAFLILSSDGLAKPKTVTGSGSGTYVTTPFNYDGSPAVEETGTGKDSFGHAYSFVRIVEFAAGPGGSCTAPDGTNGDTFLLVQANMVIFYNNGKVLYGSASEGADGNLCSSLSTLSKGQTVTYSVSVPGGSTPAGTLTLTQTNQELANGFVSGGFGVFGALSFKESGAVSIPK